MDGLNWAFSTGGGVALLAVVTAALLLRGSSKAELTPGGTADGEGGVPQPGSAREEFADRP
jgi:hypothetical protein